MSNAKTKASEEQMAYAGVLNIGMWLGLAVLVMTFFVYISGSSRALCRSMICRSTGP